MALSISYMEGAMSHSARHRSLSRDDTPANLNGVPSERYAEPAGERRPFGPARAAGAGGSDSNLSGFSA